MSPEARARLIMLAHPFYWNMDPVELVARIDMPLHVHRGWLVDDRLFFTAMRPEGLSLVRQIEGLPPQPMDWVAKGPNTWIVDLAATDDAPRDWIHKTLNETLMGAALCEEGDWVYYRRHSGQRFGRARVRDGRRRRSHIYHAGERPVEEHAPVPETGV